MYNNHDTKYRSYSNCLFPTRVITSLLWTPSGVCGKVPRGGSFPFPNGRYVGQDSHRTKECFGATVPNVVWNG